MIRRKLTITGKVQGVFYRAWFSERAAALGLDGWVRNREQVTVGEDESGEPLSGFTQRPTA